MILVLVGKGQEDPTLAIIMVYIRYSFFAVPLARVGSSRCPKRVLELILWLKHVGTLLAKNGSLDVFSVVDVGVDSGVLLQVVFKCGDVEECLVLEHSCAHPSCEFFDVFLDVGEEGIRAPTSDEHDCVHQFVGEVYEHSKAGSG